MRFSKYHGIGNDFVMLPDLDDRLRLTPEIVRALCDRRFGIGGDGVIRVGPGDVDTDFFMDYVNSDGSIGEMCGNGIRCLAMFVNDQGYTASETLRIGTRAGIKIVELLLGEGQARVDMGPPIFVPDEVPVAWSGSDALHAKIELKDSVVQATCLSMGNPHAVIFIGDDPGDPQPLGSVIETHPMFPKGTNVEIARVQSSSEVRMRVWERGAGETLACGTGACAVAVAAKLVAGGSERMTVALPGGDLQVEWEGSLDDETPVFMIGPAVRSFVGDVDLDTLIKEQR